jgi:FkbM family methyltransferase
VLRPRQTALTRELRLLASRAGTGLVSVESHGAIYLVDVRDRGPSRLTYLFGNRLVDDIRRALAVVASNGGPRGGLRGRVFVDVGANIGTSTVPALRNFEAALGVAFEPGAENFDLLRANLALNGLSERVEAQRVALSDRVGRATLALSGTNRGDHRLQPGDPDPEGPWSTETVAVTTFDECVRAGIIPIERLGLVWIDVQGFEGHVLGGAEQLLASGAPVHLELWPDGLRRTGGLERLLGAIRSRYDHVVELPPRETNAGSEARMVDDLDALVRRYRDGGYTNVVLLGSRG